MTDKFKVITDMAVLMTWHNLHRGASSFMVLDWCTWAVNAGHVEYVYDGDEMIGFLDWVRSSYIPSNHDTDYQAIINSPAIDTGEIGIVLNCCVVRGKDTLRKLIKMA